MPGRRRCPPRRCSPATASPRARSSRDPAQGAAAPQGIARARARRRRRQAAGGADGRSLARAVLERVEVGGAYANRALSAALDRAPGMTARRIAALATELVYGVLRRRGRHRPRAERAGDAAASTGWTRARCIALRVGAYQILFLDRVPAYAAVDDAVEACKRIAGRGVAGFANALLRRLARRGRAAAARRGRRSGRLSGRGRRACPPGSRRCCSAELPAAEALAFAASIADTPPVTLRANTGRVTRDELAARLTRGAAGRCAGAVGGRARRARRAAAGRAGRDTGVARRPVRDRRRGRAGRRRALRRGGGRADPRRLRGHRRQDRAPAGARGRSRARRRARHRHRQAGRRRARRCGVWA